MRMIQHMWFTRSPEMPDWSAAERYLSRCDPALRGIIRRVGPCTLSPRRDYFVVLCKAIYGQQISTAIATLLFGRFRDQFPNRRPTPARVHELLTAGNPELIRKCGLSRQKTIYLTDLSRHFLDNEIPRRRLNSMSDEEVIDALVRVKGIGRWTAEMFLIFVLNRPDVLPVDDLGLREAVREVYKLAERPTGAEVTAMGETWKPYRTIATWYLWRRGTKVVPNKTTSGKGRRVKRVRSLSSTSHPDRGPSSRVRSR